MTIQELAELVILLWVAHGMAFFLYSWLNLPTLIFFAGHRVAQLRDRRFDLRVTTPIHTALHFLCALIYGLLMPAFYFLSVRTRHRIGIWELGPDTNSQWTILLGVACMIWLAAHLIEAASRLDRPRFRPHLIDRGFAALGVVLCLWLHVQTSIAMIMSPMHQEQMPNDPLFRFFLDWIFLFVYPQTCFLGATLVFGIALWETFTRVAESPVRRRWRLAVPIACALMAIVFAPFWLSIPRVTHRQAMALLTENRDRIAATAEEANLDPALLAGIIYVAHTRDHPRLFGDRLEELSIEIWDKSASIFSAEFESTLINASAGLCQVRPTTAVQTIGIAAGIAADPGTSFVTNPQGPMPISQINYRWDRVFSRMDQEAQLRYARLPATVISPALRARVLSRFHEGMGPLLLDPHSNLALAASMLCIFREQWRVEGFPIDDRPEILATLYNIGYERSIPHGAPRANDFGRRVADFMQTDECRDLFPEPDDVR